MKLLPNKFPSISRIITENKLIKSASKSWSIFANNGKTKKTIAYSSIFLTLILIVILLGLLIFVSFNFSQNLEKYISLNNQRTQIQSKINFWNSITQKYDGYPDAYFNIAVLYFELSDFRNARRYFDKALLLNPDYKQAKKLDLNLKELGY